MKKLAVFAVAAVLAASAFAQNASWMGNSWIFAGADGAEATWYDAGATGQQAGAFNGHNFGSITTLLLGGQIQTYGEDDATVKDNPAFLNYSIDDGAGSQIALNQYQKAENNNWFQGESNLSLNGYHDGEEHSIKVYFSKPTSNTEAQGYWDGNIYETNDPHDYTANFTGAVPEPATMSLLGIGALAMALRRKLRK